jgi:hypothetical protein
MQSEEDGRRGLGWDEKEGARWSAPTSGIEARARCGWDHQAATARPLAGRELAGVSAYARGLEGSCALKSWSWLAYGREARASRTVRCPSRRPW